MPVAWTQVSFRGRNDDGSEATATWKQVANTNFTQKPDTNFRLRFCVSETGSTASTHTGQIQYNRNAAGWVSITGSSTVVKAVDSTNFTDDAATTKQLATGTFVAGKMDDVSGATTATASIAQNSQTDMEYCLQILSANVNPGDTIQFRDTQNGTAFGTYTATPTVTVEVVKQPAAGSLTMTGQAVKLASKLAVAAASMVITGAAVTITNAPGAININPAAGSLTITGTSPALRLTGHPATGSIVMTGATPALKSTVHPATGSLTITGAAVTITNNANTQLDPAAGSLTITGAAVKLNLTGHPAAATLTITGATSTLKATLHPATASLVITGANVSITNAPPGGSYQRRYGMTMLGVG